MAESVFTNLLAKNKLENAVICSSAATHTDEIGSVPHRGTREKLAREGIPLVPHRARLLTRADGERYDLILGMDDFNVRDAVRIVGEGNARKVRLLLSFSSRPRAIADPWYTGDFEETFSDIMEGCEGLLSAIRAGKV